MQITSNKRHLVLCSKPNFTIYGDIDFLLMKLNFRYDKAFISKCLNEETLQFLPDEFQHFE